jgi:hypothetical protein
MSRYQNYARDYHLDRLLILRLEKTGGRAALTLVSPPTVVPV